MHYNISFSNPHSHYIDIELNLETQNSDITIQLPNWRPGRYEIQNFAKRIRSFKAFDKNQDAIEFKKVGKSSWQLNNLPGPITIQYEYYAFKMDAGNSWLDEEQLYINFINCCMYEESMLTLPCEVNLNLPHEYQIACGLSSQVKHTLISPNYYQLVDSPLIASPSLRKVTYETAGCLFHIWVQGELPRTDEELISDFRKFTDLQIGIMHDFPCTAYHFLFQSLPYKHYHGVEHWNSTVITIGPSSELNDRKLYKELLGVSSHELFHTWNVIRLRPEEMTPYNFQNENYHETGFITEGITTYYGDLLLARSGVFSLEEYLVELNKLLKRHYDNEGRKNYSVAESSFDLWLDGYEKGIPGRKVSIYNEGALAALILDLTIRLKFDNKKSLDNVMRLMWNRHGKDFSGYSYEDYRDATETVYEESLDTYFEGIISGTTPYEVYLEKLLPAFGLNFELIPSNKSEEQKFGFRLDKNIITDIASGSPAKEFLSIMDAIETINGNSFKENSSFEDQVDLVVNRFGRKVNVRLSTNPQPYFSIYKVSRSGTGSNEVYSRINHWLQKCIK